MKFRVTYLFVVLAFSSQAQPEFFEENSQYGLTNTKGDTILAADYNTITLIPDVDFKNPNIPLFYRASQTYQEKLFRWYNNKMTALTEEEFFSSISYTYVSSLLKKVYIGITETGIYKYFNGVNWNVLEHVGYTLIGGCNSEGKWAVCQGGVPMTAYIYDGVIVDQGYPIQVKTNGQWKGYDHEMNPLDSLFDLECYPHYKFGYLCTDNYAWQITNDNSSPVMILKWKLSLNLDDSSYTDLETGFPIIQNGKYGVVDRFGNTIIPFVHEYLYVTDRHTYWSMTDEPDWMAVINNGNGFSILNRYNLDHPVLPIDEFISDGFNSLYFLWNDTMYTYYFSDQAKVPLYGGTLRDEKTGLFGYSLKGGYLLWPYEYEYITRVEKEGDPLFYLKKEGVSGIYSHKKEKLIDVPYAFITHVVSQEGHYFIARNDDGIGALVLWDREENTWQELTDFRYQYVSDNFYNGLLSVEDVDDNWGNLQLDGKFLENNFE